MSQGATAARLADLKGRRTVAVCLPALNEESTVGTICAEVASKLMAPGPGLVDELLVMDDRSTDRTREAAEAAGARVVGAEEVLARCGGGSGKGNALWKSLAATEADLIVWCDADLVSFDAGYVTALLAPLLADERIVLVKGYYERLLHGGPGGGRTTELMARPLLAQFFPDLAQLRQPLGGEYAVRRDAAVQVPFVQGWGVEVALLIDLSRRFGADRIAEADLGVRRHRNRTPEELSPQALAILQTVLQRAGVAAPSAASGWSAELRTPGWPPRAVTLSERPPICEVRGPSA
ncbi:MAG: glucosyl-3-phosphoglycerate synthase [bacterium]|nr:glucosyl-3-phosphoglycerate synthase [bacterium]MCY3925790.1 glucosyl-3-phosphoglycerate synthase [bacterium]